MASSGRVAPASAQSAGRLALSMATPRPCPRAAVCSASRPRQTPQKIQLR